MIVFLSRMSYILELSSSESRFVSYESILLNKSSGNAENDISDKVHAKQIQRKIEQLDKKDLY